MQIIIVAGGGGTRLWPLSVPSRPKQFAKILDDSSLLEQTYNNLAKDFDVDNIWVATNEAHKDLALKLLPEDFKSERLILEPEKRDTFAAVSANAAVVASKTSDEEPLIFVPCDDYMQNQSSVDIFNEYLGKIGESLQKDEFDFIITMIKPNFANPNYGYVEIDLQDHVKCFDKPVAVKSFTQKPDEETAEKFIDAGNYLWNKFNPSFKYSKLKAFLQKNCPEVPPILDKIYSDGESKPENFSQIPKADFDVDVIAKSDKVGGIGLDILWDDIGSWITVEKHLPKLSKNQQQTQVDGSDNKVHLQDSKRKVAFVGVSNLLLVETEEGILVVDPRHSGGMKEVAKYFEE